MFFMFVNLFILYIRERFFVVLTEEKLIILFKYIFYSV